VAHDCAVDYLRVYPHIITEYTAGRGTPSMFVGKYWLKDAEGIIKNELEAIGKITPFQIRSAIESLCNITRIVDPELIDLPLDEAKPLPEHVIPIKDGLLNLADRIISPHSPDYFYTEYLPRTYIKGAIPEEFIAFIDKIFTGDRKAEIKKTHIFETIAWTLMRNYKIQGAVILFGQGGEGKSIIHDIIGKLLVRTSELSLDELENEKFKRYKLYGSWANLISESSTKMVSSEMFKRVTDGSIITVEEKNGRPFRMRSHAKMIIDTNELPNKSDELRAFYRRVIAIIDFPNMLEDIMSPKEIDDTIAKLESDEELDKLFSYVIDNFYGPLVDKMKFTKQLNIDDARTLWEERSNPALAYLRRREKNGDIITDVEDAKSIITEAKKDINLYISKESGSFDEYLDTPKQEVINDAVKWATDNGFPVKNINAGNLGKALNILGYQNITVDKKIGKGIKIKAWKDLIIITWSPVSDAVPDPENHPRPPDNQSNTTSIPSGTVSSSHFESFLKKLKEYRDKDGIRYRNIQSQQFKWNYEVPGDSSKSGTDPRPPNEEYHSKSENPDALNKSSTSAGNTEISQKMIEKAIKKIDLLLSDSYDPVHEKDNIMRFLLEMLTEDQANALLSELKK